MTINIINKSVLRTIKLTLLGVVFIIGYLCKIPNTPIPQTFNNSLYILISIVSLSICLSLAIQYFKLFRTNQIFLIFIIGELILVISTVWICAINFIEFQKNEDKILMDINSKSFIGIMEQDSIIFFSRAEKLIHTNNDMILLINDVIKYIDSTEYTFQKVGLKKIYNIGEIKIKRQDYVINVSNSTVKVSYEIKYGGRTLKISEWDVGDLPGNLGSKKEFKGILEKKKLFVEHNINLINENTNSGTRNKILLRSFVIDSIQGFYKSPLSILIPKYGLIKLIIELLYFCRFLGFAIILHGFYLLYVQIQRSKEIKIKNILTKYRLKI